MNKEVLLVGDGNKKQVQQGLENVKKIVQEHAVLKEDGLDSTTPLNEAEADLVITLGGDGTVLSAARSMGDNQLPILGINMGKLGFLAAVETDEVEELLPDLLEGNLPVQPRSRVLCQLQRDGTGDLEEYTGLNEIVLTRGGISRMVSVEVRIDGEPTARFDGDGIIVSTPTGSTAHNLSAGGPVLAPDLGGLVVTPLAPHTLTLRPLVVSENSQVQLELLESQDETVMTVDGQVDTQLGTGDVLHVSESETPALLVQLEERSFYYTLNEKLHWARTPRDRRIE